MSDKTECHINKGQITNVLLQFKKNAFRNQYAHANRYTCLQKGRGYIGDINKCTQLVAGV